jgi:hypothetical protein
MIRCQSKFKLIGITGQKYNGKDTIADYLCQRYGYKRVAFADPLKNACGILFGFNHEQLHGSLKEVPDKYWFGLTPRKVLQFFGTDLLRKSMRDLDENFGENFWLLCADKTIKDILSGDEDAFIVISDVRFPNECEMIKNLGGTVIRVNRPSVNGNIDAHDSEKLISTLPVHFEINNDKSLDNLYREVDKIVLN